MACDPSENSAATGENVDDLIWAVERLGISYDDEHFEPVAVLEGDAESHVFLLAPNGGVAISETVEVNAESRLSLILASLGGEATGLEVYLALSEADEAESVPEPLVANHEQTRGPDAAPRRVALPRDNPSGFRSHWESSESANCTQAADLPWFQGVWMGWDWDWHYYYNFAVPAEWSQKFTAEVETASFFTHACNYSVADWFGLGPYHHMYWASGSLDVATQVHMGYRHTWLALEGDDSPMKGEFRNGTTHSGNAKLGAAAPP
jgi:hypothetical protein